MAYLAASPNGVATSNNASFNAIDIEAGNVPSGQTLTLNAIGTATTANLGYVFPAGFTVSSGATMTVAPNLAVQIPVNTTFTDSGAMSFGTGDTVTYTSSYGSTTVINVNGSLYATGTTFTSTGSTSQLNFSGTAHFSSTGSTYNLSQVSLGGTALGTTDLSGNYFNTSLYLPESDVQDLATSPNGVAAANNASFSTIDIEAGNVPSGQTLTMNAIGTATTANLLYAFPAGFTVSTGGIMNVGPGVSVQIPANETLTDNGSASFGTGDTVTYTSVYGSTTVINVYGSLTTALGPRSPRPARPAS